MKVRDVMTPEIDACRPEEDLGRVARRMFDADRGALPVLHPSGALIGMITDRDICMAAASQMLTLEELLVGDHMVSDVVTCRADEPLEDALRRMAEHQLRRLPVFDEAGAPCGILGLPDLARAREEASAARTRRSLADLLGDVFTGVCRPYGAPEPEVEVVPAAGKQPAKKRKTAKKTRATRKRVKS